ncbi:MAG: hypothetical protein ACI9RP_002297, partial [Cyclobacteriaceae bacterium]
SAGGTLLYTSTRNGQTDIIKYELASQKKVWLSDTPGGEYSPVQIPGSFECSAVQLEQDGRQLLWRYSLNGGKGQILIPYLKIGYHAWVNENLMFAFVLGPQSTLQKLDIKNQRAEIIRENIGRSLHHIASRNALSFIDKANEEWLIKLLDINSFEETTLTRTPEDSEDMVWTNQGLILMGDKNLLLRYNPGTDLDWELVADLSDYGLGNISRLAMHPSGEKIAIVVFE